MGSLVTKYASEKLPQGVSPDLRNVRYTLNSVATRYGFAKAFDLGEEGAVNGLGVLIKTGQTPTYFPYGFTDTGKFRVESPVGSGGCIDVLPTFGALPLNAYMEAASVFQRSYLTFGDGKVATSDALVYDGTYLDPLSMRPVGETWAAAGVYQVGEIVCPTVANGHMYRCTQAGTSAAAEPVWTLGASAVQPADGTCLWQEANMVFSTTGVGNVCVGLRYIMVLFVSRSGYISGCKRAAVQSYNVVPANAKLKIDNVPLGPANTAQRIVALGPVSESQGGPFSYLPIDDLSDGVSVTKSVIDDNVTTSITLNYSEAYLRDATDVTDNLRKIKLPPQASIFYVEPLHRFFLFGEANQPSLVRVSEADDPETFYGDTGYMYVSRDDGQRAITAREWRGEIYVLKERGAYVVQANNQQDPGEWELVPRWRKIGPCGSKAVDSGPEFMAFAHRSGGYIYQGEQPIWVTKEIDDLWSQINWDYGHLITVHIDAEYKEVRFAVPFGTSTLPNVVFTMNHASGLEPPIHFSAYAGKEVTGSDVRKWSIDDLKANNIIRAERAIDSKDKQFAQSQILFGSPDPDGIVYMIQPGTYMDNGDNPIDSYYEVASAGAGSSYAKFGGFIVSAIGEGKLACEAVPLHGKNRPFKRPIDLEVDAKAFYRRQIDVNGRQWGVRFSNNKQAGAWFEIFELSLYLKPWMSSEMSDLVSTK